MTWKKIEDAPQDCDLIVYAPEREELPYIICICRYHPDAGFCVDELRYVTHWMFGWELVGLIKPPTDLA